MHAGDRDTLRLNDVHYSSFPVDGYSVKSFYITTADRKLLWGKLDGRINNRELPRPNAEKSLAKSLDVAFQT